MPTNFETSQSLISRRSLLKMFGMAGFVTNIPYLSREVFASQTDQMGVSLNRSVGNYPDWLAEARIGGLTISGAKVDYEQMKFDLDRLVKQGVNVVEADSRLSDYLSEEDFAAELILIKKRTQIIHARGLKVVWYIPSLEVITANGLTRQDSFARTHPDWLQVSFDEKSKGVFYGQKVFWVAPNDESAWLCPNTPYGDWFKNKVRRLAETGLDGLWLDVPIFDLIVVKWGCACPYCKSKFTKQTGLSFPQKFDVTDRNFWNFIQWRHRTITEFLNECNQVLQSVNPNAVSIAEIVALDHMGATLHGSEGSALSNIFVVWEVDAVSETTAMAEASYDDWIVMHNIFKYCRGATMDRPSWVFCYGFNESDAQLVLASAVAAQNNPYELRTPEMTSTVGNEFREMMFKWVESYSKPIFRSNSVAPVAVIYSERNRDFLDALHAGGIFYSTAPPGRGRKWLGKKSESPQVLEYMGDYRGLSLLLYQQQIPTDIFPFSRVDADLLKRYKVIVLPYMASLTTEEKKILLEAVQNGTTLIVSGPKPGMWDGDGLLRKESIWRDIIGNGVGDRHVAHIGKGKICFWADHLGRNYISENDQQVTTQLLSWMSEVGVAPWTVEKLPVVVQPYIYEDALFIHVLNYAWVGKLENKSKRLSLKLLVPWDVKQQVKLIVQSEPQWANTKTLSYKILKSENESKILIYLEVGINCLVKIKMA